MREERQSIDVTIDYIIQNNNYMRFMRNLIDAARAEENYMRRGRMNSSSSSYLVVNSTIAEKLNYYQEPRTYYGPKKRK
jgi:hypothetical protein